MSTPADVTPTRGQAVDQLADLLADRDRFQVAMHTLYDLHNEYCGDAMYATSPSKVLDEDFALGFERDFLAQVGALLLIHFLPELRLLADGYEITVDEDCAKEDCDLCENEARYEEVLERCHAEFLAFRDGEPQPGDRVRIREDCDYSPGRHGTYQKYDADPNVKHPHVIQLDDKGYGNHFSRHEFDRVPPEEEDAEPTK